MTYEIPNKLIPIIRNEDYGIIYLTNSDTFEFEFGEVSFNSGFFKLRFFGRNAYLGRKNKVLIKWRYNPKYKNKIHLCFIVSRTKTSIKDLLAIIRVFEELVKIKGYRKIITFRIYDDISSELLERLGYKNIEDDMYEKNIS